MKKIKNLLIAVLLCFLVTGGFGCASCNRSCKSCTSDMNGGLYRTINIYTMTGDLLATYEGMIDIDNNANGSIMFDLNGKRYVYYNAIIEVIEK